MFYSALVTRHRRTELLLPAELLDAAHAAALADGDQVSNLVRDAVAHAARAVIAGRGHTLPPRAPRRSVAPKVPLQRVAYKEGRKRAADVVSLLAQAGSSTRAVATAFLEGYVAAGGDRLRCVMPGDPGTDFRPAGAA